jgi:hypothetical protein
MFLTLHQHGSLRPGSVPSNDAPLVEVLDLRQLADPFAAAVLGRIHAGEELQDAHHFAKSELRFPSGESLPRCWCDPAYPHGGQR